jgi:hypothetical protein
MGSYWVSVNLIETNSLVLKMRTERQTSSLLGAQLTPIFSSFYGIVTEDFGLAGYDLRKGERHIASHPDRTKASAFVFSLMNRL